MLKLSGTVVAVTPTKSGSWQRVLVPGQGRPNDRGQVPNDLVMFPSSIRVAEGQPIEVDVRAQVETDAGGRPTRAIVYWLADTEDELTAD